MRLVKLDAIDSTNDYLKDLVRRGEVDNFTVITAEYQTKGKGQMGATWTSEVGKNLIMSVLVKDFIKDATAVFDLNMIVALAVADSLRMLKLPNVAIKWPNDIMSANKKIGGILIENSFRSDGSIFATVGLGLNVNQVNFEDLPQASSIAVVLGFEVDKEMLLNEIITRIKKSVSEWNVCSKILTNQYTDLLFRKDLLTSFQASDGSEFQGRVKGISKQGKLVIEHAVGTDQEYDIKEVKMLY